MAIYIGTYIFSHSYERVCHFYGGICWIAARNVSFNNNFYFGSVIWALMDQARAQQ